MAANLKSWVSALAALGITACTTAPIEEPPVPVAEPERPQATAAVETASRPAPPPEPPIDVPAIGDLLGLTPVDAAQELGPASFIRRDLGSEIWQYRTDTCVLFLFIYENGGTQTVDHIDTKGGETGTKCIEAVVRARASRRTG